MLEGLFGDEDELLTSDTGPRPGGGNGKSLAPPAPRPSSGLCGIKNQGSTCYLNSLLQTLLYTPEFRESLFQLGTEELGNLADKEKPEAKVRVIPIQLQRLFSRLLLSDEQSCCTTDLTDSFGWTNNEELQQHDVQELNRILFSAIESSLVGTSGQDLISKFYHGSIVNQIVCQECGRISEREEDFLDLTVAVAGYQGLNDALNSFYNEMELMSGNNQYKCEKCQKLVDATKGAKLRTLPPILTVSLLRFSYDFVKFERYKETGKFTFPMELDMAPYCEDVSTVTDTQYELFSVVIHKGSSYGGHYQAYIRDVDSIGKWTLPEDEPIQMKSVPSSGTVDYIELGKPEEVLSAILIQEGGLTNTLTLDKLCQSLISQTGVSWNKRFKKQYGPINKFLKNHDDIFEVNSMNSVTLKTTRIQSNIESYPQPQPESQPESQCVKDEGTNDKQRTRKGNGMKTTEKDENQDKKKDRSPKNEGKDHDWKKTKAKRDPSPLPRDGYCWFDFNDSRVHPIREKEIQKQFSGKQSAYMLFYRRKSLHRPTEAKGQPAYRIPERLQEEVTIENAVLEKEREKYEIEINTIEVKLLQSHDYQCFNGAINMRMDTDTSVTALSIDRRKSIAELKTLITEVLGDSNIWDQGMLLHVAKEVPAGIHLYQCISVDDTIRIEDTGVMHGSQIFLWDGEQVDGVCIRPGDNSEPLLLTVTYNNSSGVLEELTRAFPKDVTIGELKAMLYDYIDIPVEDIMLSRVHSKPVMLYRSDDSKTLTDLKFENGEKLTSENRKKRGNCIRLAEAEAEKQNKMMSLIVENRCCKKAIGMDNWPVVPVEILRDQSVEALKAITVAKLGLSPDSLPDGGGRLRIHDDNHGLRPSLHENQSMTAAGITQGLQLVFEPGAPPRTNQITITFTPDKKADMEIIVDKNITVEKFLKLMLNKCELEGHNWHISKTNWCGEAADIMDDPDLTLEQEHMKNGDHVLIQEGKLPPRGFIRLPIYLYKSPNHESVESSSGVLSWITSGISNLLATTSSRNPSGDTESDKRIALGDIEISKDATLEDLKCQVMTLPQMIEISPPTVKFVRIRLLENNRPTRILRNLDQTLKRQKLSNGNKLCVQVLSQEEDLDQNCLVLNICQRMPNTRSYSAEEELMWNVSRGASPAWLKQKIADKYALPVEHVKIAKHVIEKFEWLVVQDMVINPPVGKGRQTKGKRKSNVPKINLRQAPYHLKDGDTIGVLDLRCDSLNKDDFSTADDDLGKENLRKEAEERKKRRKENRMKNAELNGDENTHASEKSKTKKPEVGIRIHVGDFR
ncbi:LOW QUALITY PROTEIN: ubiquitin carboxyl-terminal hydrolase 40-like [Ptychodera flava]|uniref:LOW QUALITY PROTEIN: ubiquitin carboxyl-terminal hydrolase 40-like n=1 Tax=Ptychodera flava TaxID=63121 RepID=UPI00396A6F5E